MAADRLTALLLLILAVPALGLGQATKSGHGIVFSALVDDVWRVHFQASLAETPTLIGNDSASDSVAPSLSPDGSVVAFERKGGGLEICEATSGGSCRTLETGGIDAVRPVWRVATDELVFVRFVIEQGREDSDLFVTGSSGGDTTSLLLQTGIQDFPDISPNGRHLVYTSTQALSLRRGAVQVVQNLWVVDLESGRARQLIEGSTQDIHADWSPSGRELAFASNRSGRFEIWRVGADGTGLRQVTSGPGTKTWPAWAPDGESIMFTVAKDGRHGLWLVNPDGSDLRPFEPFGRDSEVELRDADWR